MSDSPQPYRVLARKYRPRNFRELIGQDAMALRSADAAMQGLKPGTVDYLRAQDIAMVSRAAVEQKRKDVATLLAHFRSRRLAP